MAPQHAIVVGSGLAGLAAASQLLTHNIPVVLLERAARTGGNSIKASSGINGAPTPYQPIQDSREAFYNDSVRSAMTNYGAHRMKLIARLTDNSASAVEWLVKDKGIELTRVAHLGGHTYPRTHRGVTGIPPGYEIVSTVLRDLKEDPRGLFDLRTSCTVTSVLQTDQRVTGVEYEKADGETVTLHGPVIFASGGFAGAADALAQYQPDLAGYPSTNDPRPASLPLLTAVGAQLLGMQEVQVHPTGFVDPVNPSSPLKFLAPEMLRGEGGILLRDGHRFVNELETRDIVTQAITSTDPTPPVLAKQWNIQLVLDESTYNATKSHVDFYLSKGLMKKSTIADLGPEPLDTITGYCSVAARKAPDEFNRKYPRSWTLQDPTPESVVYVGTVTPVIHYTMGGALINENAQILREDDTPIEGLWGAGEVTGGVHGRNRLGGSSLLECVVFGRIAGDQCAEYIKSGSMTP
ncbi:Flavocytochrome c [Decorospora gaudefroyi]|uniref:Fumarate reductase n=1 Tax=Decorospora gaudefroyi TaxID=184978 RepID=A0A6A5KA11_9PLEO|nr:Flavocytochrome c [Decorospora gaudefroyi]